MEPSADHVKAKLELASAFLISRAHANPREDPILKLNRSDFLRAASASVIAPQIWTDLLKLIGEGKDPAEAVAAIRPALSQSDTDTIINNIRALTSPAVTVSLDAEEHPDNTIMPGQPLDFEWGVHDWRVSTAPGKNEDPSFAGATATLHCNGVQIVSLGTERRPTISASLFPQEFYRLDRLRPSRLELQVTIPGVAGHLTARLPIRLVPGEVPLWEWVVRDAPDPAHPHFAGTMVVPWNRPYTLSGRIQSRSPWSITSISGEVVQEPQTDDPPIDGNSHQLIGTSGGSLPVSPSSTAEIAISPAIQWTWAAWPWFDRITLMPPAIGAESRMFTYVVHFTASDEYHNPAISLSSRPLSVIVYVSDTKIAVLGSAFAAQVVAAALLAAAAIALATGYGLPLAIVLVDAASYAEGAARTLEALAMDPPVADPRYMQIVPFPQGRDGLQKDSGQKQDPKAQGGATISNLMAFLRYAQRIAAIPAAMSLMEGKLMGARQAQDQAGVEVQSGSFVKAIQAMVSDTEALVRLLPAIRKELSVLPLDTKAMEQANQKLRGGIPQELRDGLNKGSLSDENQKMLSEALKNPDVAKETSDIDAAIEKMARAIAQVTYHARQDAGTALMLQYKKARSSANDKKGGN